MVASRYRLGPTQIQAWLHAGMFAFSSTKYDKFLIHENSGACLYYTPREQGILPIRGEVCYNRNTILGNKGKEV